MLCTGSASYAIVGGGDDRAFLEAVATRLRIRERVHFLGPVSDDVLAGLYRDCAAFVLPSGQEGFGIVYLEAMYFCAPVIAARAKGVVDVVRDEATGLLVAFGDVVGLSQAMDRLLTDHALRERLREAGRQQVTGAGAFTFGAFAERTASILNVAPRVLRAPAGSGSPPIVTVPSEQA
jgi:glycosyltransferase involved in cell wall biosynthesis